MGISPGVGTTLDGHSGFCLWGVGGAGRAAGGLRFFETETLKVWELESGQKLHRMEGHWGWVMGVAVTPDGQRAVSASMTGTLKVWELESGRELHTLNGYSGPVYCGSL